MTEFKVKCEYTRIEKRNFFNNEKEKEYHRFWVKNPEIIPDKYCSKWKGKFDEDKVTSWIWISDKLVKEMGINKYFEVGKQYQFVLTLGKDGSAIFWTKTSKGSNNFPWHNNMILKTSEYFENTVKKIGFWDSENYFYEAKKVPKKTNQSKKEPIQPENKSDWGKIALVCLPIIIIAFFSFLIIKWVSKKNNKI